jgi:undecaprenyl diphosphate synthase
MWFKVTSTASPHYGGYALKTDYAPLYELHQKNFFLGGHIISWQILGICSSLDIKVVSVYAFAIDNFKRPQEEVDALMSLAEKALLELCSHG